MTGRARRPEADDARLIVRAGRARYAIRASRVREIVRLPRVTPVPLGPPILHGLGNVRGETIAILGPARNAAVDTAAHRLLVVLEGQHRVGIAVDMIENVERGGNGHAHVPALPVDSWIADAFPVRETAKRAVAHRPAQTGQRDDRVAMLRFLLGEQDFALPLEHVAEVTAVPTLIAALPGADDVVIGTIIWRDRTIGLLSLAALLGFDRGASQPAASGGGRRRIIIVSVGGQLFGLQVDRLEGLLRIAADRIDPVPPTLQLGTNESRIAAICRLSDGGGLVSVLATDHLLGEARTRQLAVKSDKTARTDAVSGDAIALLLLAIGEHRLALPLSTVEQVVRPPNMMTRLPDAPDWLLGVTQLAGAPLAIIDQTLRLTGSAASGAHRRLIIVQASATRVGFLVDDARTILRADRAALAPAPLPQELVAGIYGEALTIGEDSDPLLLLDPAAMLSSAERDLIRAVADHGSVTSA